MDIAPDSGQDAAVPFGTFRPGERRALIGCSFAAMCILLMPQEFAGSGICLLLTVGLYVWHRRKTRREQAAAAEPPRAAPSEPRA